MYAISIFQSNNYFKTYTNLVVYFLRFQVLPKWLVAHPNAIQTGNEILDSVLTVICSTSILVGGLIGCFLDNTIPGTTILFKHNYAIVRNSLFVKINTYTFIVNKGTPEERGLIAWANEMNLTSEPTTGEERSTYDFPVGMNVLRKLVFELPT